MNASWLLLLLSACLSAKVYLVQAAAESSAEETATKEPTLPCTSETEGQLMQVEAIENATCGTIEGRVKICNNGEWRTICSNWTIADATVTCRQLGYSDRRASVERINLGESNIYEFKLNCQGSESNITSCPNPRHSSVPDRCDNDLYRITCFLNESTVGLCYDPQSLTTAVGSQPVDITTEPSSSENTGQEPLTTAGPENISTEFLTTPLGIGIITVICVVVLFIVILLVVISLLVCRKSSVTKLEQSRISPQDIESSLKDSESSQYASQDSKLSNSPGRSRVNSDTKVVEQYFLASDPLYERVQDVTIPILATTPDSANASTGNSAEQSPQLPTYSTLERNKQLKEESTYSTLNIEDQVYAQVEPYINGSLPRDASLQIDPELDNFDTYHRLDRSNSQSSHRKTSVNSSPPTRPAKHSPSTPRNPLPSISDVEFDPFYAEVNPTQQTSSTNAALVPGHRSLRGHRSNTVSGRPATHEQVSPKGKSSTLPHSSKSTSHVNYHGVDVSEMYAQVDKSAKGNNTWV